MQESAPRLSVNLNKVALLRNSRRTGVPNLLDFARIAQSAGADGITVHPRPDERHIRRTDVFDLAALMQLWRPHFELNIEGYPDPRLLEIVDATRPEQCTLVPDAPGAFTSDEGWRLHGRDGALARAAIPAYRKLGCRVVLFIDPDPQAAALAADAGADGIEIYTGGYAQAMRDGDAATLLQACAATAAKAVSRGLVVNIGHDLNLTNILPLVGAMPLVTEASIGHELTADALVIGFAAAVAAYKSALQPKVVNI